MTAGGARALDRVCFTVPDLVAAVRFYAEALGFLPATPARWLDGEQAQALGARGARVASVRMRLGTEQIELLAFDPPGRAYPAGSTARDPWFQHCAIVVREMAAAHAHLAAHGVVPITEDGPQRLPPNTGSVTAYKFRDPFGHPLEVLCLPEGVGDARWHRPDARALFLGIDHTAIVVSDAERSVAFYETVLGLRVTGRSRNTGREQSQLDAVPDAVVDVVALSPPRTPPHLELLAYRPGRRGSSPAPARPADISLTRTVFLVDDADAIRRRASAPHGPSLEDPGGGPTGSPLADPDGHCVVLQAASAHSSRDDAR